ncbi:MAG: hypothetical protein JWO38_7477 [Gemmataceae bacterium]|nr:hypothetical protein [Gemmataceae bacterium]
MQVRISPIPPALIGSYTPPAVAPGDRVYCRYRRAWCRVTAWTDAPIPWPRVSRFKTRGGSGLLVNAEMVRAIRTERAAALMHWFGVGSKAVWNWRKRFTTGGKFPTPGSKAAQMRASQIGAEIAKQLELRPGSWWRVDCWTAEQLAQLGTDYDEVIAVRIGRSVRAVTVKRVRLKIRACKDRRRKGAR